jgi:hypothetical protein
MELDAACDHGVSEALYLRDHGVGYAALVLRGAAGHYQRAARCD